MASVTIKGVLAAAIFATSIGCAGSPAKPSSFAQKPSPIVPPGQSAPVPPGQVVPTPAGQTVPASNGGAPGVQRFNAVMSHSGTATVTLKWPDGDFSLQLYVTKGICADTNGLVTGACTILGTTRPGSLPGVVTSAVVSGDVVTVWVLNPDDGPQTFTVGVEIN
jgi:hypothetical protein